MKRSVWARQQGISYRAAWNLFKNGQLPVPAMQLATGTIILDTEKPLPPQGAALYARVSFSDQKNDRKRNWDVCLRLQHRASFR